MKHVARAAAPPPDVHDFRTDEPSEVDNSPLRIEALIPDRFGRNRRLRGRVLFEPEPSRLAKSVFVRLVDLLSRQSFQSWAPQPGSTQLQMRSDTRQTAAASNAATGAMRR